MEDAGGRGGLQSCFNTRKQVSCFWKGDVYAQPVERSKSVSNTFKELRSASREDIDSSASFNVVNAGSVFNSSESNHELLAIGYRSGKADADMMANALGLDAVLFGARAVTETTNVMKNPKRTHVAMTGGVAHSSWLGVLLHLDDDFLHRLQYNCVERGRAIFPAGRTQLFECVRDGFEFWHASS